MRFLFTQTKMVSTFVPQFIAELLPIFETIPTKFGDDTCEISDFWREYQELGFRTSESAWH